MVDILTRHFASIAAAASVEVFLSEVRWLDRRTFNTACKELKRSFNVHLYEEASHSVTVTNIVAYCKILFQHYNNQRKVGETLCLKHHFTIINQSSVHVQEDRGYTRTSGKTSSTRNRNSNNTECVFWKLNKKTNFKTPSFVTISQEEAQKLP
jgi:hypothetical protein